MREVSANTNVSPTYFYVGDPMICSRNAFKIASEISIPKIASEISIPKRVSDTMGYRGGENCNDKESFGIDSVSQCTCKGAGKKLKRKKDKNACKNKVSKNTLNSKKTSLIFKLTTSCRNAYNFVIGEICV